MFDNLIEKTVPSENFCEVVFDDRNPIEYDFNP